MQLHICMCSYTGAYYMYDIVIYTYNIRILYAQDICTYIHTHTHTYTHTHTPFKNREAYIDKEISQMRYFLGF